MRRALYRVDHDPQTRLIGTSGYRFRGPKFVQNLDDCLLLRPFFKSECRIGSDFTDTTRGINAV
jgi:hypothetical protein